MTFYFQKHQNQSFKRHKSTATAGALLQSIISHAADDTCFIVIQWQAWTSVWRLTWLTQTSNNNLKLLCNDVRT